MAEQKLIRKKKKASNSSNRRAYAEACNDLATFYYGKNRYQDALDEYRAEAAVCKELGLRMEWGTCNRMIGEMYMLMAEFDKALKYEKRHLAVAKELDNTVEQQRALATLGRIYLLQGQSTTGNESTASLKSAEKAFLKSLALCESLNGKIKLYELMDMRARLLLNIGVAQEHLGHLDKATDCLNRAITICTNQDIYDVLHQCYTTAALLYCNKIKDCTKALSCLNKAEEVAIRLQDKARKLCETLATKADVLCKLSDYQSAKQVLVKAWKMKTSDEEEAENIERKLKVAAAMCYTDDLLVTMDQTKYSELKKLYENMADAACFLNNYDDAIKNYLKMLDNAVLAGESGKALIPIYVSLYQTYKDMGLYNEALLYYEKEYELIKDEPKEAFTTLYNIAETLYLAKKPYDQIEKACLDARNAAKEWGKRKYEIRTLKTLLKYQEEYFEMDKMEDTQDELRALGYNNFDNLDNSEDESSAGGDDVTTLIGHDIRCEDITDIDDNDEEEVNTGRQTRQRRTGGPYINKLNKKGESLLHQACISGNKLMLQRLLAQNHPVNVRDYAGWTPLHEAALNGHYEVVKLLIQHGAVINDRGANVCQGRTPLHDAAANGYMDIMHLLLDNGAKPSIKNDMGHTALDNLHEWRSDKVLNKEREEMYKNICNRLRSHIRTNPGESPTSSTSPTLIRTKDKSPPSTSKVHNKSTSRSPAFKKRNVIHDDSDDDIILSPKRNQVAFPSDDSSYESSDERKTKEKKDDSGVKEYRSVISALRHRRSSSDLPEVDVRKDKPKPALLGPDDVDDDQWLDDDMGGNKNKKRKLCDPLSAIVVNKRPAYDSIIDSIDSINKINEPLNDNNVNRKSVEKQKKRISDVMDINENSSDSNENICPDFRNSWPNMDREFNDSKTKDSRDSMRRRWKTQSTLLRAGFRRNREDCDQSSNSGSDSEFTNRNANRRLTPTSTFSRKSSGENFSSFSPRKQNELTGTLSRKSSGENFCNYSPRKDGFNIMQNMNPSVMQPLNVIQPINIVQSTKNGRPMQTQILPPAAVKVQVEDKVLLISLKLDMINKLTISWLVDEVKSRYYKLTGVRPVFSLMTSDGAILSEDDPLSLVLSSPELKTCITNWKASPAEERYLECCEALSISTCEEIQQAIGRSHTTHRLALGASTLTPSQIRPLFRALTHQAHITAIMVSDNNLGDNGVKCLAECMSTMKQLTHLGISRNNITAEGARILLQMFEKASRPVCQLLEQLDISGNPITDDGLRHILKLTHFLRLKTLKLNCCKLTENAAGAINESNVNFNALEAIDISNNDVKLPVVSCLVSTLNPNMLMELDLDNISVQGQVVGCLASFMDSAKELKIRRFSLSNCKLVDGLFIRIFRSLGRAKNLQSVSLKNNMLTFITLKKLLQRQPPVPQINFHGCQDIFKYSPDSDFHVWLPAIDFGRCIPEINVTPLSKSDEERESFKAFSKTWLSCFKGRGMIEHCEGGVIRFTAR